MKKLIGAVMILFSAVLCSACGEAEAAVEEPSVTLDKDWGIESVLVESFAEDYYDLQELQNMIDQAVAKYNDKGGAELIKADEAYLSETEQSDRNVVVKLTYASYQDYNAFNERDIFVGTVPEAIDAGVQFKVALESVKQDGTFVSDEEIRAMEKSNILIVDEPGIYNTFGKILYVSDGVSPVGKKSVAVSEDMEGIGYVLFADK